MSIGYFPIPEQIPLRITPRWGIYYLCIIGTMPDAIIGTDAIYLVQTIGGISVR